MFATANCCKGLPQPRQIRSIAEVSSLGSKNLPAWRQVHAGERGGQIHRATKGTVFESLRAVQQAIGAQSVPRGAGAVRRCMTASIGRL